MGCVAHEKAISLELLHMQEIFLKQEEFLAILDVIHAPTIVGVDPKELFPQEQEERFALLRQGKILLAQRLMSTTGKQWYADALRAARIMASPHIAMIIICEFIPLGPQVFALSQAHEGIIEHTCPEEGVHRLAFIPNISALLDRAMQLLSLHDQDSIKVSVKIELEVFFKIQDLVRHAQRDVALSMLQSAGMLSPAAEAFVTSMEQPIFSGHAILLKCADQTIIDGRDIVMGQDQKTAWYAMQVVPGQSLLLVQSVHASAMHAVLSRCFAELAAWPRSQNKIETIGT